MVDFGSLPDLGSEAVSITRTLQAVRQKKKEGHLVPSRLALLSHLWEYGSGMGPAWHALRERLRRHGVDVGSARIFDIGCGSYFPYPMLFASTGVWVIGFDLDELRRAGMRRGRYRAYRERHGWAGSVLRFGFDVCRQATYYSALQRSAGVPLHGENVRLLRADALRCPLRDAVVDACVSSAAFEHLADVSGTVREMARVLKPGGIADIEIHLFPSLSGGHEFELANHKPPPAGFPVWGHLWDTAWRPPVPLNRWRERDFRTAFEPWFEILERVVMWTHGAEYLTDDVRGRVPQYPADELITEAVVYVLRKRG